MKNLLYSILIIAAIVGCSSVQTSTKGKKNPSGVQNDTVRIANDSLQYELIVIEPGFYGWLAGQPQQGYYSQSSMEISNNFKVMEYNLRTRNPMQYGVNLYTFPIEYDRNIDYGYEVNYMLYNYFLFFEQTYNQRLK
ncbi:DUF6146 family protein [uncultured Nonlabens sp.]|jgi:hypothetical protein|uniref:DUF6146 family protein n=1 Tax=uncultured Nonlabens sp. TaxID=859306 RepID=UPI0030DCDA95|tara:strand:+ start:29447 stop:29857 length:411 start_codon:yes stop_codon:yes gene_type:complete